MAPKPADRRKYPRIRAPKGMLVQLKSAGTKRPPRLEMIRLGRDTLPAALRALRVFRSTIELVFDLPTGEVRARAIVRSSTPHKGMGIQFVQMRPEAGRS